MTNDNCLEGIACPKCGNNCQIHIDVRTLARVTDDGAETLALVDGGCLKARITCNTARPAMASLGECHPLSQKLHRAVINLLQSLSIVKTRQQREEVLMRIIHFLTILVALTVGAAMTVFSLAPSSEAARSVAVGNPASNPNHVCTGTCYQVQVNLPLPVRIKGNVVCTLPTDPNDEFGFDEGSSDSNDGLDYYSSLFEAPLPADWIHCVNAARDGICPQVAHRGGTAVHIVGTQLMAGNEATISCPGSGPKLRRAKARRDEVQPGEPLQLLPATM